MLKKTLLLFFAFLMTLSFALPADTHAIQQIDSIKIYSAMKKTVVRIEVQFTAPDTPFSPIHLGSGVIIQPTGDIVTNAHLFYAEGFIRKGITVRMYNRKRTQAEIVWIDKEKDLAKIRVNHVFTDYAPIHVIDFERILRRHSGEVDKALLEIIRDIGETVVAIGQPVGLSWRFTSGHIVHPARTLAGLSGSFLDLDMHINPGNSGGALAGMCKNGKGCLIGIPTMTIQGAGIGFAIPIKRFCDIDPAACYQSSQEEKNPAPKVPFSPVHEENKE